MLRRTVIGITAIFALTLPIPRTASAGPKEDAAREETTQGTAAYNLGRFEDAAKHYEQAYLSVQDPVLLFNVGQSYRLAGKPEMAINAYRAFLRTAPDDAPNRELVAKRLAELERAVADSRVTQAAPPRGTLSTEPSTVPTTPAPSVLAEKASPGLDLRQAAPYTHEVEPSPIYKRWWFWAGVGAVVVASTVTAFALSSGGGGTNVPATDLGNQSIFR